MKTKLTIIAFYLFLKPLFPVKAQTTVDAGASIYSCRTDTIQLNGYVNDGSPAAWTGGQGTFLPNRIKPSLTATGGGGPVSDVVTLYIDTYSSGVSAGPDQIVCSGDNISLQAISLLNGIDAGTP